MSKLRKRYAITGTGLEKLLDVLKKQGFHLYNVRRTKAHCLEFSIPVRQYKALEAYIEQKGFSMQELAPSGLLQILLSIQRRRLLWLFAAAACCFSFLFLQFIWNIRITGAGIYRGEVNQWLQEQKINAGILKKDIDLTDLCEALLYRLPRITWVRARIQGVTLTIDITEGVSLPETVLSDKKGNIVASCDGVIQTVEVFSGTAAVKPGDSVLKGQVLIKGEERSGADLANKTVQAKGKVTARIWRSADALITASEYISLPTGQTWHSRNISTPWFSAFPADAPDYLTYDTETAIVPVGGAWIPLWIEKTQYTELYTEQKLRDMETVKSEAGQLAMHNLLIKCAKNDVIIDKTLNFSMIEGDTILATATAELIADIGLFAPQISD